MPEVPKDYVLPAELAREARVSVPTVHRWIKDGHLQAIRVGPRLVRIPVAERERLLASPPEHR